MEIPTSTLAGAVLLALFAAVVRYLFDIWATRRKNRLHRISLQLELLYGPLLALSYAATEAWEEFRQLHRPETPTYWDPEDPPSADEANAWRTWVRGVFMPLNERMEMLIIQRTDLLQELDMPDCLLDLCAHVEAYRGVIKQWDNEDYSRHTALVDFPTELLSYARRHYAELKRTQAALVRAGA